jgi:hypothetical protein
MTPRPRGWLKIAAAARAAPCATRTTQPALQGDGGFTSPALAELLHIRWACQRRRWPQVARLCGDRCRHRQVGTSSG